MRWRSITPDEVEDVIREPDDETPSIKGRVNLWGEKSVSRLKVTVIREHDRIVVVTAARKRFENET